MRLTAGAHLRAAPGPASAELPHRNAGFDPNVRTIWLAEGLVNYIPEAGLRTLLSSVAEVGAPDTLAMVHGTPHCPTACRHRCSPFPCWSCASAGNACDTPLLNLLSHCHADLWCPLLSIEC